MLFAVFGGIHGNLSMLESALARVDSEGIHTVFCTGNLVAGGAQPNEVVALLQKRRVICVQGEDDRLVVRALRKAATLRGRLSEERYDAILRAHEALTSEHVEFLRGLPHITTRDMECVGVCVCHGTVASQRDALTQDLPDDWFRRQREAANTDIVICGSDGTPFVRRLDVTLFVNPGSLDTRGEFVVVNTESEVPEAKVVRAAT